METLELSETGEVIAEMPKALVFKDAEGFRPVCPYFELHGEWETNEGIVSGPVVGTVLEQLGLAPSDIRWRIEMANLKHFHYTLAEQDQITALLELNGADTEKKPLLGEGKTVPGEESLFVQGEKLPMGFVQLSKPTDAFPEFRIRFYAPQGKVYGPVDLPDRVERSRALEEAGYDEGNHQQYELPPEQRIVNPNSSWAQYLLQNETRTNPGGLLATYTFGEKNNPITQCVGLVDDVGDGIITCQIGDLSAHSRVAVGPPDYAPDRRPFVSLADGLKDREIRLDVIQQDYLSDLGATTEEIRDLFEKILETMELMNLDYQNQRARRENVSLAKALGLPTSEAEGMLFPAMDTVKGRPLPLTEFGRQNHRRFVALEVIEDKLRENPDLLDKWVRKPMTGDRFYDRKMPPHMRGSDRYPMHITQRQYAMLKAWVKTLRDHSNADT